MSMQDEDTRTRGTSSVGASLHSADTLTGVPRSLTEAPSDQVATTVESSSHSFPRNSATAAAAATEASYGQHSYGPSASGASTNMNQRARPISPLNFAFPQPRPSLPPQQNPPNLLPGGSNASSPFIGYAPGFPVPSNLSPPYASGIATPVMPYSASNIYPHGYSQSAVAPAPLFYSVSNTYPLGYNVPSAHQWNSTAGSIPQRLQITGQPMGVPTTSYSTGFDGIQNSQLARPKSSAGEEDDCFNLFWLFFLLGPLTWPCALFGICSDRRSERMAGFVSLIFLTLILVAGAVVLSQASKNSDNS